MDQIHQLLLPLEVSEVAAETEEEADEDARLAAAVDAEESVETAAELEGGRRREHHEPFEGQLDELPHFEISRHGGALKLSLMKTEKA